jgi:Zn-dependent protease
MLDLIFWIIAFVVAITVHEAAHAWMADRLGDPTPKLMGRLSLNPLVHYDPIGTTLLLVLVVLRAFGAPVIPFGWAKPVRFDPYNLKNPRRDAALISLAGPGSNMILAVILALFIRLGQNPFSPLSGFVSLFIPLIILNIVLAIFNLIPIHPLDGGKILVGLLPAKDALEADRFLQRYGIIILFLLIFPTFGGASPISLVLTPILRTVFGILIPGSPII